ncbi:Protein arginine N-methyltransferase 2 [Bagarius yarrelli]|uniref:Protein arginine N-methyltransferase 2 n=1 Tax=Bagarius yarrelli TaxID=175774 RepID=A0A556U4E5_BAGYA|nr:Protein arginine N-methyltransferase 2 [Bagarius yarrelli]
MDEMSLKTSRTSLGRTFSVATKKVVSFSAGERLLVHQQVCSDWWWAERSGCFGYVPAAFLQRGIEDVEDAWQDEEYFSSYGTLKLHLEMLSDRPRTETYRQVIVSNSAALKGKVVMDLGCGTGIISLFCSRLAQPAAVYAVEASSVAEHTEKLVKLNGCDDVFEFMVESVLHVRDHWLKDRGMMWPSSASLSLVPCQAHADYSQKMEFWENIYGLDFSCLQPIAQEEFFSKPKFSHQLDPEDCLSTPCDVITLDMHTLSVSTHWKQTLFMLDGPIDVEEGDCVGGAVTLQRNPFWRRHMSVTIEWSIKRRNETSYSEVKHYNGKFKENL